FRLVDNEREVYRSQGNGSLKNVYYSVFGSSPSENAFQIEKENFDFKIEGMFSQPQHTRANRYHMWLYINDRMIRHPKLQSAIIEGFRRHIPNDRYPIGVLKIYVDPQLVDVNVHPSKWEIRLSKEEVLVSMIISAIEDKLSEKIKIPKIKIDDTQTSFMEELLEESTQKEYQAPQIQEPLVNETETLSDHEPVIEEAIIEEETIIEEEIETPKSNIEPLQVLSQMSGKYILAKGEKGLYI